VYTFRQRLDPKVALQMLRDPLFQFPGMDFNSRIHACELLTGESMGFAD